MQPCTILPTQNDSWGFVGSKGQHADPEQAWALALPCIAAFVASFEIMADTAA